MTTAEKPYSIGANSAPKPPTIPQLPIIGNSLEMGTQLEKFFIKHYHDTGKIFMAQLGTGQDQVLMLGIEANRFLRQESHTALTSAVFFGAFEGLLGTDLTLLMAEGDTHKHIRAAFERHFNPQIIFDTLPKLIEIIEERVRTWNVGDKVVMFPQMQALTIELIGYLFHSRVPREHTSSIITASGALTSIYILGFLPTWASRLPMYQRAIGDLISVGKRSVTYHSRNKPEVTGRRKDPMDYMMEEKRPDGSDLTQNDMNMFPMLAHLGSTDNTGGSTAFLFYEIARHHTILARVLEESHKIYSNGIQASSFVDNALPTLDGAIKENLRLHAPAPLTFRNARTDFEFFGHSVKAGQEVIIGQTLTHHLPEYFPDPEQFDPDRWTDPARHSADSDAMMPFGAGHHHCLAEYMLPVLQRIIVAVVFHQVKFVPIAENHPMHVTLLPVANPGSFSLTVEENYLL